MSGKILKEQVVNIAQNPEEIKSTFWLQNEVFIHYCGAEKQFISRDDIHADFQKGDFERGILKTLAWGYPNAMRRFKPNFENIQLISDLLKHKGELSHAELHFAFGGLLQIEGIGPSTLTKLLFFNGNTYNKIPCLILDERVINSIKVLDEFVNLRKSFNPSKVNSFISYLEKMQEVSFSLDISPEQLEVYLFMENGQQIA